MIKNTIIIILFAVVVILSLSEEKKEPVTFYKLTDSMTNIVSDFIDKGRGSELDLKCDCIYIQSSVNDPDSEIGCKSALISYLLPDSISNNWIECQKVNGKRVILIMNEFKTIATTKIVQSL